MNRLNETKSDKAHRENGFRVEQSQGQVAEDDEIDAVIHESNELIKKMKARKENGKY